MKAIDVKTFDDIETFPGDYLAEKFHNFEEQLLEETSDDDEIYVTPEVAIILQGLQLHPTNIDGYIGYWYGKNVYIKS
jgi:hypothetical protein